MTQEEMAQDLIIKMSQNEREMPIEYSIQCALIAVNLHLEELHKMKLIFSDRELHYKYWNEVKSNLESF